MFPETFAPGFSRFPIWRPLKTFTQHAFSVASQTACSLIDTQRRRAEDSIPYHSAGNLGHTSFLLIEVIAILLSSSPANTNSISGGLLPGPWLYVLYVLYVGLSTQKLLLLSDTVAGLIEGLPVKLKAIL